MLSYVALTDRYIDESGQITEDIRHVSLLSDEIVIQLLDEIIRSDGDAVEGGGTKAIEDQIFKVNGGGEGDVKGHETNKQEVNAVAESLPQRDGNVTGQEQTGVTDDGQLCIMKDSGAVKGEGTKVIEDQIFKVNGGGEGDSKGHGTNKQEVNVVAESLPQRDGNTNGQEQTGVTDDGQLCMMEGKIYMFSQTTGMWHELLFTDPPPVQVDQENGLFSDDSDSERGNISEQVSSVVADLVGEGGGATGNTFHLGNTWCVCR